MKRCKWCNLKNEEYVKYHDNEWCVLNTDERYLFEMLILESFQAGLSWECIFNKRKHFEKAYDSFELEKVCNYNDEKVKELLNDKNIVRNKLKIEASINNARIFKKIIGEYGSFNNYLNKFVDNKIIYETGKVNNNLSDKISKDLQEKGMRFVGTKIIYSYLQAIGYIYSHDVDCFMYKKR